jgi:hypothetical protein
MYTVQVDPTGNVADGHFTIKKLSDLPLLFSRGELKKIL